VEGRFLGLPALAISLCGEAPTHYETAGRVVRRLIENLRLSPLPADTILNVNVPDVPYEQLQGIQATRLGRRHRAERVVRASDPRGRPIYWVGPAGSEEDAGPGTDFHAVRRGFVSISPVQVDLTEYRGLERVGQWLKDLPL
jgi:5'-nucleotidase